MDRWTRSVNATLLTLFVFTAATGGLAFGLGAAPLETVVVAAHGVAGFGLLVLVPAKARIARRGLRRPGRSRKVISWALSVLVIAAIAGGLLHALARVRARAGAAADADPRRGRARGGRAAGGARPAVPAPPPDRPRAAHGPARGRGGVGGLALWAVAPGRERRFTGSHEVAALPVTQWLFDPVLALDPTAWRLRLPGGVLDLDALAALPQTTVRAVIDCTGGWWAEAGVAGGAARRPGAAVDRAGRRVGHRLPPPPRPGPTGCCWPRTSGGRPLPDGHGGPARLVVPGRRGFWWVKWVVAVEPTDEPWWWQPPLPLQCEPPHHVQADVALRRVVERLRHRRQHREPQRRHSRTAPVFVSTTALNCIAR